MKNNLSKKEILILGIIIITIIGVIGYYIYTITVQNDYEQIQTTPQQEEVAKPQEKEKIIIHIAGEVNNPGIVKIEEGARIADIIEASGGITRRCKYTKRKLSIYCRRWSKNNNT